MKIKKKYIAVCVLLCLISAIVNIGVFYIELNLSAYSKINSSLTELWKESELFVTTVAKKESDVNESDKVSYMGEVTYVKSGKYPAYNAEKWLNRTTPYYGKTKLGDKLKGYYKPDDPERFEFTVPTDSYVAVLAVLIAFDVLIVIICIIVSNIMKKPPKPKKTPEEKKAEKERKKAEKTKRKEEKKAAKAAKKAEKAAKKSGGAAEPADEEGAKEGTPAETKESAEASEKAEAPENTPDTADNAESAKAPEDAKETDGSEEGSAAEKPENTPEETSPEPDATDEDVSEEDGEDNSDAAEENSAEALPYYNPEQNHSSIMDIPVCITVAGFVICMFMGMFGGYMSVGDNYTGINSRLVSEYEREASKYTFGYTEDAE